MRAAVLSRGVALASHRPSLARGRTGGAAPWRVAPASAGRGSQCRGGLPVRQRVAGAAAPWPRPGGAAAARLRRKAAAAPRRRGVVWVAAKPSGAAATGATQPSPAPSQPAGPAEIALGAGAAGLSLLAAWPHGLASAAARCQAAWTCRTCLPGPTADMAVDAAADALSQACSRIAGGNGGWDVLVKLGDAAIVRQEATLAAAALLAALVVRPLLDRVLAPSPAVAGAAQGRDALTGASASPPLWAAAVAPLQLAILAASTARLLRQSGLTHDLFYLVTGRWGCAMSALRADELGTAGLLAWLLLRLKDAVLLRLQAGSESEPGGPIDPVEALDLAALDRGLTAGALLVGAAVGSELLHLPLARLWAALGAGSLLLGLAAQELATNLLGGLTVLTTRPFAPGDFISAPLPYGVGSIRGTVLRIGLLRTLLSAPDARQVSVPNRAWSTAVVYNHSTGLQSGGDSTLFINVDAPARAAAAYEQESSPGAGAAGGAAALAAPGHPGASLSREAAGAEQMHLHFTLPLERAGEAAGLADRLAARLVALPDTAPGAPAPLVHVSEVGFDPMAREVLTIDAHWLVRAGGGQARRAAARQAAILAACEVLQGGQPQPGVAESQSKSGPSLAEH